ncbi:hypothetical protein OV203_36195 [Nannocystis sp. ILAH1]|uniref:hypothetical protein n=1 Tax=unclassified Nannocystis TaxID=2627009 RepID=UPI002270EAFB|nr:MULTISPECIES: hypothetical protein [unclassified Nannocystis]MCY0992637.1 hypothetical protein [Nannocystis sp. ILAH1]MCY1070133.1 hypothetical protein [Nannocystis sp. RBIL2]
MNRSAWALAVLLAGCGDDGGVTGAITDSGTGTNTDATTTDTTSPTQGGSMSATDNPTQGGTMGQTESQGTSEDTTTTPPTSTTTESMTGTTTMGVDTTTGPDTTTTTTTDTTTTTTTDTTTTSTSTTDDTSTTTDGTTTEDDPGPCACPDIEVPLDDGIFVLSDDSQLWKYYPETNTFSMLGSFNCGGMTSTFSMAVDRLGFAWVMFNTPAGEIWKIDVTNPNNCIDPGYNPNQQGIGYFGMAFVSNSQFDQCDRMYGNSYDGIGGFSEGPNSGDFLSVDPDSLLIDIISPTDFNGAEMTGTGDGRVFSFGGVPSKLVERDKASGAVIDTFPLQNLPLTNAFAFAFFGGDFYFFTETNNGLVSKVTHLDYDDSDMDGQQQLTTINNAAPIRIVGAGVSTCAPFAPM